MSYVTGNTIRTLRIKHGITQKELAEKLNVSDKTISKWETDDTLPDIRQSKKLAVLYHLSLDELIDYDFDVKEIEQVIEYTNEETQRKIDWTKLWGKKFPVLTTYQQVVSTNDYVFKLKEMLERLKLDYGYNDMDAFLVLKDILASICNTKV